MCTFSFSDCYKSYHMKSFTHRKLRNMGTEFITVKSSLRTTQMYVGAIEKRLTSPCLGMLNLESLALALADSGLVAGTPL